VCVDVLQLRYTDTVFTEQEVNTHSLTHSADLERETLRVNG